MPRKSKTYHYIYKTTNTINKMYYVGMHSTNNLDDGYKGSGVRLFNSMKKYGNECFIVEILEFSESREKLKERENEIVDEDFVKNPMCMNLQIGGTSGSDYIMAKRKANPEYDAWYRKLQSEKMKKRHQEGKINYNTRSGHKHSDETKAIMSEIASKKFGDKNSQYGTCWVTKNTVNKKVKKDEFETYAKEGWIKGRNMDNIYKK